MEFDDAGANVLYTSSTSTKGLGLSSMYSTGTLYSRSLTPDDDVFQYLANTYASRNPYEKEFM